MKIIRREIFLLFIIFFSGIILTSCTAPRAILESGKVTEKGHIKAGYLNHTNIPSLMTKSIRSAIQTDYTSMFEQDTVNMTNSVLSLGESVVTYSLDPLSNASESFFRYGISDRLDAGIKYSGKWCFDVQHQIVGKGDRYYFSDEKTNVSIAAQYSYEDYKLPEIAGDIQELLGYKFKRNDLLLKCIGSISFGEDEKIGYLGFGFAYNLSFVKYGFQPNFVLTYLDLATGNKIMEEFHMRKQIYGAYGGFINFSVGYKYAYFTMGISCFFQNFGSYYLYGGKTIYPKGFSIIPSFGIQIRI